MNAAASSCLTCTKRIASRFLRSASMMPLMPSPGSPKTVSTPQSCNVSTRMSAAVMIFGAFPVVLTSLFQCRFPRSNIGFQCGEQNAITVPVGAASLRSPQLRTAEQRKNEQVGEDVDDRAEDDDQSKALSRREI